MRHLVHHLLLAILLLLVIILPIAKVKLDSPPSWTIALLFGLSLSCYLLYWVCIHSVKSNQEDELGLQTEHMSASCNPSTVGIPPSSFLSPLPPQQASIRSEYTLPPPAYRDLRYPPSYHSTQSTKDDVSVY